MSKSEPTREQRIASLLRNLDEAIKIADLGSPALALLLHVRELAEIVKLREASEK